MEVKPEIVVKIHSSAVKGSPLVASIPKLSDQLVCKLMK